VMTPKGHVLLSLPTQGIQQEALYENPPHHPVVSRTGRASTRSSGGLSDRTEQFRTTLYSS
jgi:hypothetical protein